MNQLPVPELTGVSYYSNRADQELNNSNLSSVYVQCMSLCTSGILITEMQTHEVQCIMLKNTLFTHATTIYLYWPVGM